MVYSSKTKGIVSLDTAAGADFLIDPVAFAYDFGARMYDARLGRWLSMDPLGAKYPGNSPYGFVRNNPILKIDPDGKTDFDYTITTKTGKDGTMTKVLNATIIYNVVNLSSKDVFNTYDIAGMGGNQFSTAFSETVISADGKPSTVNVEANITIQYKMVDNFSAINDNENILFIVDDVMPKLNDKEGGGNPVGRAILGGQVAAVEHAYKKDLTTILHEFGHNLGFRFSDNPDDDAHSKDPNHLMYAKGAGSGKIQLHINDTKAVFKFAAYMKDGSYHYGNRDAKKEAKSFMKTGYKYNAEKGKQTKFKE